MENYITYHKIINLLQQAQQQSPRLNSFGHGDIVYFSETMSGTTATYPYLFVTPLGISYDESTTTYQCSLIFADIVNTELSNEIDVVSDMSLEARNLLSQIKRGFLDDKIDILLPSTASPFFERMNDHVGGVVLDVSFIVFEDINACDEYPSPTTTPSVTPTLTPTSSVTPTTTPTTTPTPTITPSGTVTTQYLTATPQGSNNVNFSLWQNSGHTVTAQAICNIVINFTVTGNLGGTGTTNTTMATNDHQHVVNINSLIPGETIASVVINSVTPQCGFYNIIY